MNGFDYLLIFVIFMCVGLYTGKLQNEGKID